MKPRRHTARRGTTRRACGPGLLRKLRRQAAVLLLLLLLGFAALALVRGEDLPDAAEAVVARAERWLEQTLDSLGLRIPRWRAPEEPAEVLPRTADDQAAAVQALFMLDRIPTEPERRAGYARDDWPHWLDQDNDCRNARHEVLASESLAAVGWDAGGCSVQSGAWRDAYTGEIWRSPRELDIDHLVPLAEAHRSGGHAWSQSRRAAFANDLEDSRTLIAVSAAANRAKGDQGPEEWLPPLPMSHCRYVADWVVVKARWSLSMDERERVTVRNILRACSAP